MQMKSTKDLPRLFIRSFNLIDYNEDLEERCDKQQEEIEKLRGILDESFGLVAGCIYAVGVCYSSVINHGEMHLEEVTKKENEAIDSFITFIMRYLNEKKVTLNSISAHEIYKGITEKLEGKLKFMEEWLDYSNMHREDNDDSQRND